MLNLNAKKAFVIKFQLVLDTQRKVRATEKIALLTQEYEQISRTEPNSQVKTQRLASEIFTLLVKTVSIDGVFNVVCSMLDCREFEIGQDLSRLYYEYQGDPLVGGHHYDDSIRLIEESIGRMFVSFSSTSPVVDLKIASANSGDFPPL